jgi:AraC-like DNA-binding protein
MVGFSNHSYFAKRFQEMYGKSPKQYAEESNNNGSVSVKKL